MRTWLKETLRPLMDPRGTAGFMTLALIVGVFVGVGAALLIFAIAAVEWVVEEFGDLTDLGRFLVLITIPVGFLIAWGIAEKLAPEVRGDGVPQVIGSLAIRGGYMPSRTVPWKLAATAVTLGSGGSAGREGPIVQIGGAIGSSVARRFHLGEDQIRSLVAAGAGAAIGASFNAPIAGMLFAMEVILGNFAVRHLNAVVVASVSAAVTSRAIVGEERILLAFPYRLEDPRELGLYAALGILAVIVGYFFLRSLDLAERSAGKWRFPRWLYPVAMGLGVAIIGVIEPRVLGTGQEFVGDLLKLEINAEPDVWYVLIGLSLLKVVATSGTIGAGTSGGAFMPSLFIGATLGAGFAALITDIWGFSPLQTGAFAVVGMAATFAVVARAPLTAILIVFEITNDYSLVLPLMLAATLATFLADRVHPESVYTMELARKGIRLIRTSEVDILDTVQVGDVMSQTRGVVRPSMTTAEVQGMLDRHRHHGLPVVDGEGDLAGVITVTDIMRSGGPSDQLKASDVMTPRPVTVSPSTPVAIALERMAALGVGRLPVVAEHDPDRIVGMFRREDAVQAYHFALSTETQHELARQRLRTRIAPGANFFEFVIPRGSVADGRLLKEVAWPDGATLVSVHRGRTVMVPDGNTVLEAGDVITAFATPPAREVLMDRLRQSADGDPGQ